jgi:hypothetical protein
MHDWKISLSSQSIARHLRKLRLAGCRAVGMTVIKLVWHWLMALTAQPDASMTSAFSAFTAFRISAITLACLAAPLASHAQTEVQWALDDRRQRRMGQRPGQDFNASQKDYKIVPTFKDATTSP